MQPPESYEKYLDLQQYIDLNDEDLRRIAAVRERLLAHSRARLLMIFIQKLVDIPRLLG